MTQRCKVRITAFIFDGVCGSRSVLSSSFWNLSPTLPTVHFDHRLFSQTPMLWQQGHNDSRVNGKTLRKRCVGWFSFDADSYDQGGWRHKEDTKKKTKKKHSWPPIWPSRANVYPSVCRHNQLCWGQQACFDLPVPKIYLTRAGAGFWVNGKKTLFALMWSVGQCVGVCGGGSRFLHSPPVATQEDRWVCVCVSARTLVCMCVFCVMPVWICRRVPVCLGDFTVKGDPVRATQDVCNGCAVAVGLAWLGVWGEPYWCEVWNPPLLRGWGRETNLRDTGPDCGGTEQPHEQ